MHYYYIKYYQIKNSKNKFYIFYQIMRKLINSLTKFHNRNIDILEK